MDQNICDITELIKAAQGGDNEAREQLMNQVYPQLKQLAHRELRKLSPEQTLSTTALVHEAYSKLAGADQLSWNNRAHLIGTMVRVMRSVLVDSMRAKGSRKRGGDQLRVDLDPAMVGASRSGSIPTAFIDLEEALTKLEDLDPRLAEVAQLRILAGFKHDEIAKLLGLSTITCKRDWLKAAAFLRARL